MLKNIKLKKEEQAILEDFILQKLSLHKDLNKKEILALLDQNYKAWFEDFRDNLLEAFCHAFPHHYKNEAILAEANLRRNWEAANGTDYLFQIVTLENEFLREQLELAREQKFGSMQNPSARPKQP